MVASIAFGVHLALFGAVTAATAPIASLTLPLGWARQDFGAKGSPEMVGIWLDLTKQSSEFVPRVFLMQRQAQGASLRDVVRDTVGSLDAAPHSKYISKAQRLCAGRRAGWFLSYLKRGDPPLHVDEVILLADETISTASYIRSARQPEDMDMRKALNTLCIKQ